MTSALFNPKLIGILLLLSYDDGLSNGQEPEPLAPAPVRSLSSSSPLTPPRRDCVRRSAVRRHRVRKHLAVGTAPDAVVGDGDVLQPILRQCIGEEGDVALVGKRIGVHGCVPGCAVPVDGPAIRIAPGVGEEHSREMVRDDPACLDLGLGVHSHYDLRMAVHTLGIPDRMRGRELRSIVWDDEAGTVAGDHSEVDSFRRVFAADKPVTVGDTGLAWDLVDPAHDPAQFLAVLWSVYAPALDEPLRSTLPAIFDGVELPDGGTGERLYDADGTLLV